MTLTEIALPLFLVIDPIGNIPFILAMLAGLSTRRFLIAITREVLLALGILLAFAISGQTILDYLDIEQPSLRVAGGIILFLISLKMIFRSSTELFGNEYKDDPVLVPIAMPAVAGPSAMTAVIILSTEQRADFSMVMFALTAVLVAAWGILVLGRQIAGLLGPRGIRAMEKLMGMLLNLLAVNMTLQGTKEFLGPCV